MTPEAAVQIIREALIAAFGLAAPLLLIGFGVGIIMNLVQVATSLQDSAFSTFPRLAAFLPGLLFSCPGCSNNWSAIPWGSLPASQSMGIDLTFDVGTLYAFLLVLARISGAFIFVPIPGIQAGPQIARALLAVSLTLALAPRWPVIDASGVSIALLIGWILAEAGMGLAVGLAVAFLTEGFQMGAQIISLQAGYTYASTVDPSTGADSSVLLTIAQTAAGLLFFATGMDRQILRAFADSLSSHPPGHFAISLSMA